MDRIWGGGIVSKIGVVMGSTSDLPVVEKAIHILEEYQVPFEVRVLSAHRCPNEAREFAASARESGFSVLIAAAGMAAHLAGALAANTTLPVIGIPCSGANFDGMDALLSTVQMPGGIPVATVAVNGAKNAALLAIEILAVTDETLAAKLAESRRRETEAVLQADADMRRRFHAEKRNMEKKEQLYEGKAKKVYATEDPNLVIVSYKDDATALDGLKKGTIVGKGIINNRMTNRLMAKMEKAGIPTHFVKELSERDTLVKKVSIVPLEVIVRNISAGHFASRYGVEEGIVFDQPTIEFSYKNDDLHDPLLNAYHAVALKLATWEEIELIKKYAFAVNDALKSFWAECGVTLVDFKLEFGKTVEGQIVLADEISPDTCRLWDSKTHEKLDKDRFRRDMGGVEDAYAEIMKRLLSHDAD